MLHRNYIARINGNKLEKLSLEKLYKERAERKLAIENELELIQYDRENFLTSCSSVRLMRLLHSTLPFFSLLIPLSVVLFTGSQFLVYLIIGSCFLFAYVASITADWRKNAEEKALKDSGEVGVSFQKREEETNKAKENLERWYVAEYEHICSNWSTYPPDWEDRRRRVINRDSSCCTKCGWPKGFKRRARTLHVHHKVAISDGGKHSLSNLITLCHICHRKVDSRHHGVTKVPFRKRRNR